MNFLKKVKVILSGLIIAGTTYIGGKAAITELNRGIKEKEKQEITQRNEEQRNEEKRLYLKATIQELNANLGKSAQAIQQIKERMTHYRRLLNEMAQKQMPGKKVVDNLFIEEKLKLLKEYHFNKRSILSIEGFLKDLEENRELEAMKFHTIENMQNCKALLRSIEITYKELGLKWEDAIFVIPKDTTERDKIKLKENVKLKRIEIVKGYWVAYPQGYEFDASPFLNNLSGTKSMINRELNVVPSILKTLMGNQKGNIHYTFKNGKRTSIYVDFREGSISALKNQAEEEVDAELYINEKDINEILKAEDPKKEVRRKIDSGEIKIKTHNTLTTIKVETAKTLLL